MSPDELSQSEIDSLLSESDGEQEGTVDKSGDGAEAPPAADTKSGGEGGGSRPASVDMPAFDSPSGGAQSKPVKNIEDMLQDVELDVKIELGRSIMTVEDIIRLQSGSVVELNKLAGDPVDVLVNEQLVAKGEVLVLNDAFCIRITEIVSPKEKLSRQM